MNQNNTNSGERLSFYNLFKEKKYRVVIPIIQRDYAQGRKNQKEVRDTFLDVLYNYLEENIPYRDLDFIYGTFRENDFIPLDGQQRLTTLFLLHWYLYQISDNQYLKQDFKDNLLVNEKSMFTYETRSSSREFCDALMKADVDFNELLKTDDGEESLALTIKNFPWYYLSWDYDPTVQAMLIMLDAIHNKFNGRKEFFERLLDTEKPIITFLFLDLKEYGLTDDLYIKMNSRGKPLSSFENFKARLEQYLSQIEPEELNNRSFTLVYENGTLREVSIREYFAHNIDTKWTDLFWQYRNLINRAGTREDNNFDDELMNFIRVIFTNKYAATLQDLGSKEKDDTLEYLLGTQVARRRADYLDVISFYLYEKLKVLIPKKLVKFKNLLDRNREDYPQTALELRNLHIKLRHKSIEYILFLIDALDEFSNGNHKIKIYLPDDYKFYYNEEKVFENTLKHSFNSYHERLMFHAYISFLLYNKHNRQGLAQWMRVIHNLSHPDNTVIDSATDFSRAIISVEKLLPVSNNILEFLARKDSQVEFFSSWQVLEEKIKAQLIIKSEKWKNEIERTEKHGYFNGQIGFILEFAGILHHYLINENCEWSPNEEKEYFDKFSKYAKIAREVFRESYEKRINDGNYVFERAVLTKGDYLTEASQYRYNLLSTNKVKNNIKRDHSWKRLLRISDEEWIIPDAEVGYDDEWTWRRLYVKQVFDDLIEDTTNKSIVDKLENICKTRTNDWRDYFIQCPSLIDYCEQGFIRFENENNILLYSQSKGNHYHVEMYTYYLWNKFFDQSKIASYDPFDIYYLEVKTITDIQTLKDFYETAGLRVVGILYQRVYYEINIFYDPVGLVGNKYFIIFRKAKGRSLFENYNDKIIELLQSSGFQWSESAEGFLYKHSKEHKIIGKLDELVTKLKTLK